MLEVNQVQSLNSSMLVKLPIKSLMSHSDRRRLAPMMTRAIKPPSLTLFFQNGLPLKIFPRNRITGKANMGKMRIRGAYSTALL